MKWSISKEAVGALALILGLAANSALAAYPNPNPGILPIHSMPYGKSYGEWGDAWWQWSFAIPADINPVTDTTGGFAAMGQSGPVWFLAGTYGGTVVRTVTVPAGKALFVPIYNSVWVNIPLLGDNPWSAEQEAFIRDYLATTYMDQFGPEDLTCEIDGRSVVNILSYRCATPPSGEFMVTLPANDVWGLVGLTDVNGDIFQPGTYGPSIQDGIFLMLAPLRAGQHVIHFTASGFLDVTYQLTVEAVPTEATPVGAPAD